MPDQIYIGNFAKGLTLDRLPFNIDNDAFPKMQNFYSWRGRAKRKRGTALLGQLRRQVQSVTAITVNTDAWKFNSLALVAGAANLITGPWTRGNPAVSTTIQAGSAIVPGSINVVVGGLTYTDTFSDGILYESTFPLVPAGTINYATGAITIAGGGAGPLTGFFDYYPQLPVLGLEDFVSNSSDSEFPELIAFDTTYAYQINQSSTPFFYSVSYYKGTNNPVIWSNGNFAQFWSCNYQNAFWVTNNKPGLHYVDGTYTSGSGSTAITFNFKSNSVNFSTLVLGDVLWFNQWDTGGSTLNGQNGTVTNAADAVNGNYVITFATARVAAGTGIAQLLTNSITGQDGIRWYDGDPTNGTGLPTGSGLGWVNFAPPLTALTVGFDDQTAAKYYLVGALAILPFKDRLLFFAPQIQRIGGPVIQQSIEDVVLWSWNGTPYYNALVPTGTNISETFDPRAYYVDQTGFGGYLPAGISKPIFTITENEDVLLIGFGGTGKKTRFVYTGNDLQPFLFYLINSEMPSTCTFSAINMDKGGVDVGSFGITLTTQQSCDRIDLPIPDEIFQIQALNNGLLRVNGTRDFLREWIYFCYPTGSGQEAADSWVFPSQTLMWNYRDNTWAVLRENFTHHGTYRKQTYYTWNTLPFDTWDEWREPWTEGSQVALYASVIAGNPQGYVLVKDEGTGEAVSGSILSITASATGMSQIGSVNHCVNLGDYLSFQGTSIGKVIDVLGKDIFVVDIPFPSVANIVDITLGTSTVLELEWPVPADAPTVNSYFVGQRVTIAAVVGTIQLNGNTYTITAVTPTTITLAVDSTAYTTYVSGGTTTLVAYIGTGKYVRLSQPLVMTKQFPFYWNEGRQVRVGVQKYLLDATDNGEVTVIIALSQDPDNAWNADPIFPDIDSTNNALIYSQKLYTCPESTNLGLTAFNSNLQMPTANFQFQIWHRMNTSLLGNTFQVGITLNDEQMRNLDFATSEIALHGIQLTVDRGPQLC